MIEHVYILVGIVAVTLMALSTFMIGSRVLLDGYEDSNYRGLLHQIDDTIDAIESHYERGEPMSEGSARKMLSHLRNRRWPPVEDIRANDPINRKETDHE